MVREASPTPEPAPSRDPSPSPSTSEQPYQGIVVHEASEEDSASPDEKEPEVFPWTRSKCYFNGNLCRFDVSGVYLIFLFLFEVKLLQRFFHWLTGPDCDKDSKTAIQHCRQVRYIWGKVSPNFRPEEILEIDRIKEEWLGPFLTTFQPGTAKSYCGSASLFVDFLLSKNVVQNRGKAAAAMAQFGRLSKTLRKRTLRRRTQVETEALGKFCNLFTGWPVFMTFIVVHIVHLFLGRIARNACPDTDLPAESKCDSDRDVP